MKVFKRTVLLVGMALSALIVTTGAATAATTVSISSSIVTVTAASGVDNDLFIAPYSSGYKITDYNDTVTAGTGCTSAGTNAARCNGVAFLDISTLDGDDFVNSFYSGRNQLIDAGSGNDHIESGGFANYSDTVIGGDGDDEILGSEGNDTLYGGAGDDHIEGGEGNDTIDGGDESAGSYIPDTLIGDSGDDILISGAGDSVLDGGEGADDLVGGSNWNIATYASRSNDVTVDADGVADDGESGEGDNVRTSVDQIDGGSGNDTITASASALYGHLNGNAGDDTINGNNQSLFADVIDGGSGEDVINGNGGGDYINNLDGENDVTDCGAGGADHVIADPLPLDSTVTACETVTR